MKYIKLYILLPTVIVLACCSRNEYKYYSGDSKIQFNEIQDSLKRYSFYFEPAGKTQDTIFFEVSTIGYTSDKDRPFRICQVAVENAVNPVEGVHYKSFDDPDILKWCVIKPGMVTARVPVVLLRGALEERVTYTLRIQVVENGEFNYGESDKLWRKAEFSSGLLRPDAWGYYERTYWGPYSYSKHEWMIRQTGKKWDDEFLGQVKAEPGSAYYWKDKLNDLLKTYNENNPPLCDDDGVIINGFPN